MENMFVNCNSLTSLELNFDTHNVTNMQLMFSRCSSLKYIDVSSFNTENVETMFGMFSNCKSLEEIDVSNFNTSKVENIGNMFYSCKSLTEIDLSNFNTRRVKEFRDIFALADKLRRVDISSFYFYPNVRLFSGFDLYGGVVIVNSFIEDYIRAQVPSNWMVIVAK